MIRTPAVAGVFYPADPGALDRMVAGFSAPVPGQEHQEAIAIMAPHAGLIYSGRVAGETYRRVRIPSRAILLGPNHTGRGCPLSVWEGGSWEMPGGQVAIDYSLCQSLKHHCSELRSDSLAHAQEHCLEVQLPFLVEFSPEIQIAPVVIGTWRLDSLRGLAASIACSVREAPEPVLIVISSDMTHYEPASVAARKDRLALEKMESLDAEGLHQVVNTENISMCGLAPAVVGLLAAEQLGARVGRVVSYAHSGEVSGDLDRVVAYAGMIFS